MCFVILFTDDLEVSSSLFQRHLDELVEVIEERSNIVQQVEQDRQRYIQYVHVLHVILGRSCFVFVV